MLFNSYAFIFIFLPLTLFAFFTTAKYSHSLALRVLFFASLIFYCFWDIHYLALLLFSIAINFIVSKKIQQVGSIKKKSYLSIGIAFNLCLLGYYKYTNFFISNLNTVMPLHLSVYNIVLPLGISFFTFTQIAFLVDCYRGLIGSYQLLNYSLFVTYFPHLIAGPIIHHKEVMPQFEKPRTFTFNHRNFSLGITLFALGFFKKVILADHLGTFVSPVFDTPGQIITSLEAWVAALAYTFELYFDFSGYSDMALGISLLFGIKLPVNFYSPYKARNIIDFWRRWNMTLSRFLRDYLYISLGGNRHGTVRRYINLLLTMLLGGLWHGANWTFVIWGFLHGLYLVINHAWIKVKKLLGIAHANSFMIEALSGLLTFIAVVIGWVYFRSPNATAAGHILHAMFFQPLFLPAPWALHDTGMIAVLLKNAHIGFAVMNTDIVTHEGILLLFISALIIWLLPNSYQFLARFKPAFLLYHKEHAPQTQTLLKWQPTFAWSVVVVTVFVLSLMNIQKSSIFLYFQF